MKYLLMAVVVAALVWLGFSSYLADSPNATPAIAQSVKPAPPLVSSALPPPPAPTSIALQKQVAIQASDAAKVRAELEAMLEADQNLRREIIELQKKYGTDSDKVKDAWSKQGVLDSQNIRRLEEIIAQCGWPGIKKFGEQAATAAFLILQHSDLSYQKKYLPLARAAAESGEMRASSLALLEDRVRLREGQKQLYGSQVKRNTADEWEPQPIEDEQNVDVRRASVGLEPLSEYLQGFASRRGGRVSPKWIKREAKEPAKAS